MGIFDHVAAVGGSYMDSPLASSAFSLISSSSHESRPFAKALKIVKFLKVEALLV